MRSQGAGSPSRRAQLEHLALDRAHRRARLARAATRPAPAQAPLASTTASARSSSPAAVRTPARRSPSTDAVDHLGAGAQLGRRPRAAPRPGRAPAPAGRSTASPAAWTPPCEARESGPARARGSGAAPATRPRGRARAAGRGRGAAAPPRRGRARRAARRSPRDTRSPRRSPPPARRRSPARARPQRASSPAARGSPKVSSPTGASIPAATSRRPGRRLGALQHRHPRAAPRRAPGAGEADHAATDEHRVETALLGQTVASAGITRIRFRRSVASVPPSQPSRAPVRVEVTPLPAANGGATSRQGHNREMSFAPPEGERTAAARAAAHRAPLLRLRRAARRRRSRSAAARGARRRRRHRPAAREGARDERRSNARPSPSAASATPISALFIVNDDPDLARACDADGVHVGQDDTSAEEARELLGPDAIIGLSTHSEEQIAAAAERAGRLHQRRPGLGDADQAGASGGRPRAGRARGGARGAPVLRDRRDRRPQRRPRSSPPAPAGCAWCGRSATPPTPAPRPRRCGAPSSRRRAECSPRRAARPAGALERRRARWLRSARSASERGGRRDRASGWTRGYAKAEERNQAAREALVPLAEGERPTVVTVGAVLAGLVALSIVVGYARRGQGQRRTTRSWPRCWRPALIMGVMAWGHVAGALLGRARLPAAARLPHLQRRLRPHGADATSVAQFARDARPCSPSPARSSTAWSRRWRGSRCRSGCRRDVSAYPAGVCKPVGWPTRSRFYRLKIDA